MTDAAALLRMMAGTIVAGQSSDPASYKGPRGPLRHRCSHCLTTCSKLLKCSGCRVVLYCSQEHQVAHRPQHKSLCTKIRKARLKLDEEDRAVRNAVPGPMIPANAFETDVGRFGAIRSTEPYMAARYLLAGGHLLSAGTLNSVQEALEHLRDMHTLSRSDSLGVKNITAITMLRLDLDQECYDFIKWWATCDGDGRYDWDDLTQPYLNIHGADVFEHPADDLWVGEFGRPYFNHMVAMMILKLKLIVDIRNLRITRKVLARRRWPAELWSPIEYAVIRSPLSASFPRESTDSLIEKKKTLCNHVRWLGQVAGRGNGNFLPRLLQPDEALASATPHYSGPGSREEAALAIQYSYPAWWETEGVLELMKDAHHSAERGAVFEVEIELCDRTDSARHKEAKKLRKEKAISNFWDYIQDAVDNYEFLGPPSDRPSECRERKIREEVKRETGFG